VDEKALYRAVTAAIKKAREDRGLTQEELAATMGIARTVIANVETGHSRPMLKMVYTLAEAIGVSAHALLPASVEESVVEVNVAGRKFLLTPSEALALRGQLNGHEE
jgi:transcriptional regulator with XRE-family HTH domain